LSNPPRGSPDAAAPTLAEATAVWARIGVLSFGGPAAQIALMHRELVEERGWLDEDTYLNALSFCMLLPGPEAMQLATFAGWRLHGTLGGLIAGLLFVLPGALIILLLATGYLLVGDVPLIQALFLGVKAAVLAIVFEALLRVGRRALTGPEYWVLALASFAALFVFDAPYPLVVLVAGLWGFARGHRGATAGPTAAPHSTSLRATAATIAVWAAIWWVPILAIEAALPGHILGAIGRFFSVLATVTFGGAYAVLAYMAQEAVGAYGWLTASEMADALGLAETTPGPLILVTAFVGFLAAARNAGGIDLWLGFSGAAMTLWATFVPCFLWIFAGAPYIDRLRSMPRLRSALKAITSAVVGVILNLSIWFALQVTFSDLSRVSLGPLHPWVPDPGSFDWRVPLLTLFAGYLLLLRHWSVAATLAASALAGLVLSAI
jgi:chromate transporter